MRGDEGGVAGRRGGNAHGTLEVGEVHRTHAPQWWVRSQALDLKELGFTVNHPHITNLSRKKSP